jgi:hypothetical protein
MGAFFSQERTAFIYGKCDTQQSAQRSILEEHNIYDMSALQRVEVNAG